MPRLQTLSGSHLVAIFEKLGFFIAGQKGSHIKLKRESKNGVQILVIPNHKEIDKGTLKAIYNQALRFISDGELQEYFYSD